MISLATTIHDPENRLYEQMCREWPKITKIFSSITVNASPSTSEEVLAFLREHGAHLQLQQLTDEESALCLGEARRDAVVASLTAGSSDDLSTHSMYCDFDRVLHWSQQYSDELRQMVAQIAAHDFTVFGRTPRAFATHPRIQRDTEQIINHVFSLVSGSKWDITAAARGISRRAAEAIRTGCHERSFGVDAAWPLFIQRLIEEHLDLTIIYVETEGLEFETVDRYMTEASALGGVDAWIAQLDADPKEWSYRTRVAWIEIEAMQNYVHK